MKRVVLKSEIRDEYEEKLAIEKDAFTTVKRYLSEEIRELSTTCDKMNVELELLTAKLSDSSVAFDEKVAQEVASAIYLREASYASNCLDKAALFNNKHATELANVADVYEVKPSGELESVEEESTRKGCIAESILQRKLAEEMDRREKYYLKYKQYTDMWQTSECCCILRRGARASKALI